MSPPISLVSGSMQSINLWMPLSPSLTVTVVVFGGMREYLRFVAEHHAVISVRVNFLQRFDVRDGFVLLGRMVGESEVWGIELSRTSISPEVSKNLQVVECGTVL